MCMVLGNGRLRLDASLRAEFGNGVFNSMHVDDGGRRLRLDASLPWQLLENLLVDLAVAYRCGQFSGLRLDAARCGGVWEGVAAAGREPPLAYAGSAGFDVVLLT